MKIITIQKIGYNQPAQANWSYSIFSINTIDTDNSHNMSYTVKGAFTSDTQIAGLIERVTGRKVYIIKSVSECPKITGVSKMLDAQGDEIIVEIKDFLNK